MRHTVVYMVTVTVTMHVHLPSSEKKNCIENQNTVIAFILTHHGGSHSYRRSLSDRMMIHKGLNTELHPEHVKSQDLRRVFPEYSNGRILCQSTGILSNYLNIADIKSTNDLMVIL